MCILLGGGGQTLSLFFLYCNVRKKEIKKLDQALSKYVRFSNADKNGLTECYTCGCKKKPSELHNGHFVTRAKYSTRWLYDVENNLYNCKPQCPKCNLFMQGMSWAFGNRLDQDYGEGSAEKIVLMSNQTRKFSTQEIIEMRENYVQLFKEL